MGKFLVGIVTVSLVMGILNFLSYRPKSDKTTRAAMGIILMWVVSVSIFSGLSRLSELDFNFSQDIEVNVFEGEYIKEAEKAYSEGVKQLLYEKYGIEKEEFTVSLLDFDFEKMRAEKIKITLFSSALFSDFRGIENYIEKTLFGECEVNIAIE